MLISWFCCTDIVIGFLDYFMLLFVINAWLDLFILCLFACFCLFDHVLFV